MATTKVTSSVIGDDEVKTVNILDANVTTAKVADNAITLAKLAHGTDGNLITYDAAGAPAAVATGTSGQVLTSNGAGAAPTMQTKTPIIGTKLTASSSTLFSSLPSGVKWIDLTLVDISTNGTADVEVQLGESAGGLATTGYVSNSVAFDTASPAMSTSTSGFHLKNEGAANAMSGTVRLTLHDAVTNEWACTVMVRASGTQVIFSAGDVALSGALDRVKLVSSDTFDGGTLNIVYGGF